MADCSYVIINGQKQGDACFVGIDSYYGIFDYTKEEENKVKNSVTFPIIEGESEPYYELDDFGNFQEITDYPYKKIGLVGKNLFLQQLLKYIKTDSQFEFLVLSNDGKIKIIDKDVIIKNNLNFIGFRIKDKELYPAVKLAKQAIIDATKAFLSYELKQQGIYGIPKKIRRCRNVVIDVYLNNKERIAMYDNLKSNYFGEQGNFLLKTFVKK